MQTKLTIINVARYDIEKSIEDFNLENSFLISINDPDWYPPKNFDKFKYSKDFYFLDIEDEDNELSIQYSDAEKIIEILKFCNDSGLNVVVHCTAGICRSGAVTEVAEMLGFKYIGNYRQPNVLVKKKLIKAAGFANSWE